MNNDTFSWPENADECATLARSIFISECAAHAHYWLNLGTHLLTHSQPDKPFVRWNTAAEEDHAFREVFATLTELQRSKLTELLEHCITGAVFGTLCTLDQFPHGDAEVFVRDGLCGSGTRSFRIAPRDQDLHDDFYPAYDEQSPKGNAHDA